MGVVCLEIVESAQTANKQPSFNFTLNFQANFEPVNDFVRAIKHKWEFAMNENNVDFQSTIKGFEELAGSRIGTGWEPYFLNFMFKKLPDNNSIKFSIMRDEVARIYSILITHVVRRPNSPVWDQYRPVFIGCPDNKVFKREHDIGDSGINDGWHYNGVILLPPEAHSRFREHLANHFITRQNIYVRPSDRLQRIHVTMIESGTMIDYTLKHFKRGNISADDILLLPRARSEMTKSKCSDRDLISVEQTYMTGTKLHLGYELLDRLDKLWRAETADFDPYLVGQPEMSREKQRALIRSLRRMRKECRSAIQALKENRDRSA